ncbi:hypothetical protein M422DRAFT_242163 [Sphaerobolus stellatus SS14]|nr:hypothetical protein M422DRAFT_242163 [Sphaerobolus stellatus SS14]
MPGPEVSNPSGPSQNAFLPNALLRTLETISISFSIDISAIPFTPNYTPPPARAGVRGCEFNPDPCHIQSQNRQTTTAGQEVFLKTVGFFCALIQNGCTFESISELKEEEDSEVSDSDFDSNELEFYEITHDIRSRKDKIPQCSGKLVFRNDSFGRPFIQCEKRGPGHRDHLRIRNLNEYNLQYLQALLGDDLSEILKYEEAAKVEGYGPLVPCKYVAAPQEQKQYCPNFHRDSNGVLSRGRLLYTTNCKVHMEFYLPNDLQSCPYVAAVSHGPHSHENPRPSKTPGTIQKIFLLLLGTLGWGLADATPCKILLDTTFMTGLRKVLNWQGSTNPVLSDFHPSLGNLDHCKRLINGLRSKTYPYGTGFNAALQLLEEHRKLPVDQTYVRVVEKHEIGQGTFHIIICMFKTMSKLLSEMKRLTIDTSFKRIHGWQEFEIESWFPQYSRSIVVARAYITSQSADAHLILFRRIFDVMKEDTGCAVRFRHIHSEGIETVTADQHRGQALGLGKFCQEICRNLDGSCLYDPKLPLCKLTPPQHLSCFLRICFQHISAKVHGLSSHVQPNVVAAMMSLASAHELEDFDGTLAIIRRGGKKAADWLKDKLAADGFALAGMYRPKSKIPLDIWQAAPNTTNGNEQAHRNINRRGTKQSLFAGLVHGLHHDTAAMVGVQVLVTHDIQPRDQAPSYYQRSSRSIVKSVTVQKRTLEANDKKLQVAYSKAVSLQETAEKQLTTVKRAREAGRDDDTARKRLQTTQKNLEKVHSELKELENNSSGRVPKPNIISPSTYLIPQTHINHHPPSHHAQTLKGASQLLHPPHHAAYSFPASITEPINGVSNRYMPYLQAPHPSTHARYQPPFPGPSHSQLPLLRVPSHSQPPIAAPYHSLPLPLPAPHSSQQPLLPAPYHSQRPFLPTPYHSQPPLPTPYPLTNPHPHHPQPSSHRYAMNAHHVASLATYGIENAGQSQGGAVPANDVHVIQPQLYHSHGHSSGQYYS